MRRTFVLINNSGIGGTERRLGRLFAHLANQDPETNLIINRGLWRRLIATGLLSGDEKRVQKLPEPCSSVAGGWFWIRKVDYLFFSCVLIVRYAFAGRRIFHFALGGAYIGLPLMLLRPDHRTVISVVTSNLSTIVGTSVALRVYLYSLRRSTMVDALTETVGTELIRHGIPVDKIQVSKGSAMDTERCRPARNKELSVVFAGRLIEEKNPLLFVEAMPAVIKAIPAVRFFILGEGSLREVLETALNRLGVRHAVTLGFREDPTPILSTALVFVSLQKTDNYPSQALLEAMACGAAIVATDVGLTWKLVDEKIGMRVKADPASVAEAILRLLKNTAEAVAMGQRARQRIIESHPVEAYLNYLDDLHRNLTRKVTSHGAAAVFRP
jgi:glycosyltransferase involved in cell wall biosynthesis